MENKVYKHIELLVERYPCLSACKQSIIDAYELLERSYVNGGKLLVCGNGGSSADSGHIVGELMKGFKLSRRIPSSFTDRLKAVNNELGATISQNIQGALPAIDLTAQTPLMTAFMNDCDPQLVFAQQVGGYGKVGDVFLGISTSGNSKNVLYAAVVAKACGLHVIGLTGEKESKLMNYADVCIRVPETETFMIQELHLPVYHCLCLMLESRFFETER